MRSISFRTWTVPFALLLLCVNSYGTMSSKLGVHMDDWNLLWFTHSIGPKNFPDYFSVDRPLLGWLSMLTASVFGESPLVWQYFGIFTRWFGCLALWLALKALWPDKTRQVVAVAFLFAVYPGFISLYIPFTYAHHIFMLGVTLLSLGAMNWSLRQPRWFWLLYLASLGFGGFAMFTMEYYFGLELLRPVFLWMILSEGETDVRKRLWRLGLYWSPYVLLMLLFLVWRISTPTPRGVITIIYELRAAPLATMLTLGKTIAQDIFEASVLVWKGVLDFGRVSSYGLITTLKYALIVLGVAVLSFFYLSRLRTDHKAGANASISSKRWALEAILLGLYALLLGGIPVWTTNIPIDLSFPWDRFTMALMLGVSLLSVGLVELVLRTRIQILLIYGIVIGIAAGYHFTVALTYRREWLVQRDFFWQMVWRAPGIEPGTAILIPELPFQYNTGYSLTAPLNWTYAPENISHLLPYLLYDVDRYDEIRNWLSEDNQQPLDIQVSFRKIFFNGSTSQAIVALFQPPACLKVIDPQLDRYLPDKPRYFHVMREISDPDLISPAAEPAARPPAYFFGPEPEHDWCYYFQKAELARQVGDWEKISELGDQALGEGKLRRRQAAELMPFIEGYARIGQWEKAVDLSRQAYQTWGNTRLMLCNLWEDIHQATAPDLLGQTAFEQIQGTLECGNP